MLRNFLLTPVWVFQLFTQAKSFKSNPVIGNRVLNRLGLHVLRLVLAHGVSQFKWLLLAPLAKPEYRAAYRQNGYVLIENFLEPDHFQNLEKELETCRGEVRECIQGDTLTHRIFLDEETLDGLPACEDVLNNKTYQRLLGYCSGRLSYPLFYVQSIKNHFARGKHDPQKVLHSDTFHPNVKAWLFVTDVDENNGPFTYVPGSNRLTLARLKWEYARSIAARDINDGYSEKGSFRVEDDALDGLGLPQPHGFKVKRNTLVIANTYGFHRRGDALEKSARLEIWAYSRGNPFNPIPGVSSHMLSKFGNRMVRAFWRHQDAEAAKKNRRSSWHIVPEDEFHAKP